MRSRKGSIHTRSLHKSRAFPKWSSKFAIQAYHPHLFETKSHSRLRKISHYQTIKMSEAAATPAAAAPAKVKKAAKPKKPAAHPSYQGCRKFFASYERNFHKFTFLLAILSA